MCYVLLAVRVCRQIASWTGVGERQRLVYNFQMGRAVTKAQKAASALIVCVFVWSLIRKHRIASALFTASLRA